MVMIRCPAFEVQAFAGIDKLRVALQFWVLAPKPGIHLFLSQFWNSPGAPFRTT